MNDTMDISGIWEGSLVYGKEYGEVEGKMVYFELELTQKRNKISGLSKDTGGFGINPDPADVKGKIRGKEIDFVKQYRSMHYADEDNTIDKSRKGPKIYYSGKFDESLHEFKGTWQMGVESMFFGIIPLNRASSGTWKMKRKFQ